MKRPLLGSDPNRISCRGFLQICVFFCIICTIIYIPLFYTINVRDGSQAQGLAERNFTWNINSTRDLSIYVQPENLTAIISNENLCEGEEPFLLIVVCSAVKNFEARETIRQTWMSYDSNLTAPFNIRIAFLLGQTINDSRQSDVLAESKIHGDIIQEGFIDAYLNLTLKSVMLLKWVKTHCSQVTFVLKTDDDMYVNIPALIEFLSKPEVRQRKDMIVGSLFCRVIPIKDLSSKWYTPKFMFNEKEYPDYVSGTGYAISGSLVGPLFENALRVPLFHLEDVFTTGMVARKANIVPENYHLFSYLKQPLDNACLYRKIITSHGLSLRELRTVWRKISDPRLDCTNAHLPKIGDPKMKKCRRTVKRVVARHLARRAG